MRKRDVYTYWSCWRKVKYQDREAAEHPKFKVYRCKNCKGFHRATKKD